MSEALFGYPVLAFYEAFHIGLPKIRIKWKNASNKSCSALNCVQKVNGCICLSSPGVEVGTPNIIMYKNGEVDSL